MRIAGILLVASAAMAYGESPKAGGAPVMIRGILTQAEGRPPALEIAGRKQIPLAADPPTLGVLADTRLAGVNMELRGHFSDDVFQVDPIHTFAMHVHKDGKRRIVTYWCEICSIRYYTPGKCWCCQNDTALDLREPEPDDKE